MTLYDIIGTPKDEITQSFINYILEDKSKYVNASTKYIDRDNDFLIGTSDGILMNINFIFINTDVFCEVGKYFTKYGRYCEYKQGSIEYKQFWARELDRRRNGMVANCKLYFKDIDKYFSQYPEKEKDRYLYPLRITGTHYNYLNYGRIDRTQNEEEKRYSISRGLNPNRTIEGFPRFWDGSYWKHKLDEFALDNMLNRCDSKARRKGFTFQESNDSANILNLVPNSNIIHAAYDKEEYLIKKGKLTYLTKRNLEWFDKHTYFRRGFLKEDLDNIILGYKKSKQGNKSYGILSSLNSVGLRNNTSSAAGATALRIKFEESGVNPVLKEAVDVTMSVNEVGANRVGNIGIFGTGGTKGSNWEAFSNIFYNPLAYSMVGMENIWDRNARHSVCGFFFPQLWCYEPYIDIHGNSKLIDAYYVDALDKIKAQKDRKGEDLLLYLGQRANSPEEAFITTIENMFTSVELSEQIKFIRHTDDIIFTDGLVILENGRYKFKSNEQLKLEGIKTHPYLMDVPFKPSNDNIGCIRLYFKPYRNIGGDVPIDQYFITYDTVKIDKKSTEITHKHSLNSFHIWEKPNKYNNLSYYRIVATYCGRFNTLEESDRLVLNCCEYWNCGVLFEYGSGETYINFKKWNKLDRLLKDPTFKLDQKQIRHDVGYGIVIGDGEKKLNGLTYLKEFLYEVITTDSDGNVKYNLHYIFDFPTLKELEIFNLKGNFDRISSLIVAIYFIKSILISKQKIVYNLQNSNKSLNMLLRNIPL